MYFSECLRKPKYDTCIITAHVRGWVDQRAAGPPPQCGIGAVIPVPIYSRHKRFPRVASQNRPSRMRVARHSRRSKIMRISQRNTPVNGKVRMCFGEGVKQKKWPSHKYCLYIYSPRLSPSQLQPPRPSAKILDHGRLSIGKTFLSFGRNEDRGLQGRRVRKGQFTIAHITEPRLKAKCSSNKAETTM